ncbi:MAG: ferrous iron transport protein A [Butyricicoccus sp.]
MKTLASLKPGQSGVVRNLTAEGAVKQRFLDMGITRGVSITMERRAPFGDPLAVRLRGYSLSLRKDEAQKICLEEWN